jgi:hypothetical protein
MMRQLFCLSLLLIFSYSPLKAQRQYDTLVTQLLRTGLGQGEAFPMLMELTSKAGHRLSGSEGAQKAVELTLRMMKERGFDNVHLEKVMVPRWVRGSVEEAAVVVPEYWPWSLDVCALGGTVGTPETGTEGAVIEVKSFEELRGRASEAKGKIVFFNRAFDPTHLSTFTAYGGAVDQRARGAIEAAKVGAVAVLVRSMTLTIDEVPHTGAMNYEEGVPKIPAAAISTRGAEQISEFLADGLELRIKLFLSAETLPDIPSFNVVGDLTGSEFPSEIIVVGGHLDSWDKGSGAHDDGAGCVQAIEALNLIKKLGLRPNRTIRAVMFMNEENGLRGGKQYVVAPERKGEKHIAALESDRGGFAPRGISVQADSAVLAKILRWQQLFARLNAGDIGMGYSGVDISPLVDKGTPGFGLDVENHRYFDYHHSDNDTIDKVNARELELGAIVEALLVYLIAEEGM